MNGRVTRLWPSSLGILAFAMACGGAAPPAAVPPSPEAVMTELAPKALAFINSVARYDFSAAEALLDTKMAVRLPRAKLESLWADLESTAGEWYVGGIG